MYWQLQQIAFAALIPAYTIQDNVTFRQFIKFCENLFIQILITIFTPIAVQCIGVQCWELFPHTQHNTNFDFQLLN